MSKKMDLASERKMDGIGEKMPEKETRRTCPICGEVYFERPALSRIDNETMICPDCGCRQAMGSIGIDPYEQELILKRIHQTIKSKAGM